VPGLAQPAGQLVGQTSPIQVDDFPAVASPRPDQPPAVVDVRIAVAALVTDPPAIKLRVFPRLDSVDPILVLFDPDRAAGGAAGAYARMPLQVPHPLLVEELLVAQGAHRAVIDHIAGELVVQGETGHHVDFFVGSPADDHQFARAGNLPGKPHALAAHHAAVHKQGDLLAHVAPPAGKWSDVGPALVLAVQEVVVL
jgi:hypothetical protein